MTGTRLALAGFFIMLGIVRWAACEDATLPDPGETEYDKAHRKTVDEAYPDLTRGALYHARLADLPDGVLVAANGDDFTVSEWENYLRRVPEYRRSAHAKAAFYVIEQKIGDRILLARAQAWEARQTAQGTEAEAAAGYMFDADQRLIHRYLASVTETPAITDEEARAFYDGNGRSFGRTPFDQVKLHIIEILRREKTELMRQNAMRDLGKETEILVARDWAGMQSEIIARNPLCVAASGKKPVLAVFSSGSCCGPDVTQRAVNALKAECGESVSFVSVNPQYDLLSVLRYRIDSAPTWLFLSGDYELRREVGDLSSGELKRIFSELGWPPPKPENKAASKDAPDDGPAGATLNHF